MAFFEKEVFTCVKNDKVKINSLFLWPVKSYQNTKIMNTDSFALRHIGPRPEDVSEMLAVIGVDSIQKLMGETIPDDIRLAEDLELPEALSEQEFAEHINQLAQKNKRFKTYIGLGYHATILPAVIQRNILENPGWYTAYTPYQAEIAQGRLEALLNFQTMVSDLTGLELANASLLDEATAAAEAMTMLHAVRSREKKKNNADKFFVSEEVLPQTLEVLKTRSRPLDIILEVGNHREFDFSKEYFGALLQYPGRSGQVYDYADFIQKAKDQDIKVAVAADILSLVKLRSPGDMGADVVVGTTQRFGVPMGYGGPHAAYFATKDEYKRNVPGRIIGVTKDVDDHFALRMALQTREQHIKRARATSNICTAQVLLAVMAGMYAVYHGPEGLSSIADKVHHAATDLENALRALGFEQTNTQYFDTLKVKAKAEKIRKIAEANSVNFYYPDAETVSIALNETTSESDLNAILAIFATAAGKGNTPIKHLQKDLIQDTPVARNTEFLIHPVFNSYRSETELMRYIKKLERKDLSLTHSMIALGSCTMKLNAAAEMLAISNPQWGNIHPFVPFDQAQGYQEMIKGLEKQLSTITGLSATSLQPNSGAQGEFAGLMVIRSYHEAQGDTHRNVCLIPASAHGTNPASATMAGMKVVVVKSTEEGNIDVEDLQKQAEKYKDNLAALMVTYPSTHGVFESSIRKIVNIVHENGGQVYLDGANMNAQVGYTHPGKIGADVCHLNLHKTFSIPHGGGGPGVGPICVAAHLQPFLPSNAMVKTGGSESLASISAAPYGSALVCLISYGYICMLGKEGVKQATEFAILNANYMKGRLDKEFSILYSGEKGRAAHEMILDCREFKEQGIEVMDIAKRLMDYGFHAPTVSFPVVGTLMIEPTESESKAELDRFCEALLSIKKEIEEASADQPNNVLRNAPHTLELLTADTWDFPYSREKAAYPLDYLRENKFWPTVRRVDDVYGDRNFMCTCPPVEDYV